MFNHPRLELDGTVPDTLHAPRGLRGIDLGDLPGVGLEDLLVAVKELNLS